MTKYNKRFLASTQELAQYEAFVKGCTWEELLAIALKDATDYTPINEIKRHVVIRVAYTLKDHINLNHNIDMTGRVRGGDKFSVKRIGNNNAYLLQQRDCFSKTFEDFEVIQGGKARPTSKALFQPVPQKSTEIESNHSRVLFASKGESERYEAFVKGCTWEELLAIALKDATDYTSVRELKRHTVIRVAHTMNPQIDINNYIDQAGRVRGRASFEIIKRGGRNYYRLKKKEHFTRLFEDFESLRQGEPPLAFSSSPTKELKKAIRKEEASQPIVTKFLPPFFAPLITSVTSPVKGGIFEKVVIQAFISLGFEVVPLGQGSGKNPDCIAIDRVGGYALIIDAKYRQDGYSLGTDYRAFNDYIKQHSKPLKKQGLKVHFLVVSNKIRLVHDDSLRETRLAGVETSLLPSSILVRLLTEKFKSPSLFELEDLAPLFLCEGEILETTVDHLFKELHLESTRSPLNQYIRYYKHAI